MVSATEVWASPEWYPVTINSPARRIRFVRMSRHTYRESVFLDSRIRHLGEACAIGFDALLCARAGAAAEAAPVHYVFHTAFCCSTLLARYLELLPHVLVLKEPGVLSHVAVAEYDSQDEWLEVATLTLALLSRTYDASQAVCIKAGDCCNSVAQFALAANSTATATFQLVPLRLFVLSVLKSAGRRQWAQARAQLAAREGGRTGNLRGFADASFTDGQAAAFVWLVNGGLCRRLKQTPHSSRLGLLDGEQLAMRPEPYLKRVLSGTCLNRPGLDVSRLADSSVSHTHSKAPWREFDATTRSRELAEADDWYGGEADMAVSWASDLDPQGYTGILDLLRTET